MSRGGSGSGSNVAPGENRRGDGRRIPRVEREIREIVSMYLLSGFRGKLPGYVSVTRVILSGDMRQAKVLVTMMGVTDATHSVVTLNALKKSAIKELQMRSGDVQHQVNRRLQMKNSPRLTFIYDEGFEHAMKVENVLRSLRPPTESKGEATSGEKSVATPATDATDND